MVFGPLLLCLVSISVVFAQFGDFGQSQFGQGFGGDSFMNNNFNRPSRVSHLKQKTQLDQQQDQATGNAAAAGNAAAQGDGAAASINQANHQATKDQTASNSLSANTATGFNPTAGGAAQAGGSVGSQRIRQNTFGSQFDRLNFRRKRQSGFGSGAQGNSIGGGSALLGNIFTQNTGFSQATPFGATGFGAGSASGSGFGLNVFNAASSNAFSRR